MDDEAIWKRRFLIFAAMRLSGLVLMLAGMGIALGDFVRPGGWPLLGGVLIVVGLIDALVMPRLLKRQWNKP